ncbi:unnamed protein product [Durusdinium trenchii]|uniref:Uncharacterized protein n=1 Tax=Durusdinium trenchii TaxID=1381693 RepID=A0ABP0PV82_9DINO
MVILVRETGCCHGCWALFRGPSEGKSNEGHHAVVVQESAELTEQTQPVEPLLSLEARIAARQDDAESLELLTSVLRRSIRGLDEQGRSLLFYAVRGNRDDGGKAQASAAAVAKKLLGDAAQWDEVPRYLVKRRGVGGGGSTDCLEVEVRVRSLPAVPGSSTQATKSWS